MSVLVLPLMLQKQFEREARAAFPSECCGLIEGTRDGEVFNVLALHPTRNLAEEKDRFEIDPAEQFKLMRSLRGTDREIVGCYHSHPNGKAEPSARDGESEDGFLWLIAALDDAGTMSLSAHRRGGNGWRRLAIKTGENAA
jgi:proteasome lid subunit RPN8/RPN11